MDQSQCTSVVRLDVCKRGIALRYSTFVRFVCLSVPKVRVPVPRLASRFAWIAWMETHVRSLGWRLHV
eukprot:scaffold713_cov131-Cylindrotheca_fusiformis.AAC.11